MGRTSDAREKILASAMELLHERGYSAVGIAEVCERSGVNKGSFYYFFKSKQNLALAVIDDYSLEVTRRLTALADPKLKALTRFNRFFSTNLDAHQQCRIDAGHVRGCLLGNLVLELSTQDEKVRERVLTIFETQQAALTTLISEMSDEGLIPKQPAKRAAGDVLALLQGATLMAKAQNDCAPLQNVGKSAMKLLQGAAS